MNIASPAKVDLVSISHQVHSEMKNCAEWSKDGDREQAHMDADDLLCLLLRYHGHDDIVDEFNNVRKWYA